MRQTSVMNFLIGVVGTVLGGAILAIILFYISVWLDSRQADLRLVDPILQFRHMDQGYQFGLYTAIENTGGVATQVGFALSCDATFTHNEPFSPAILSIPAYRPFQPLFAPDQVLIAFRNRCGAGIEPDDTRDYFGQHGHLFVLMSWYTGGSKEVRCYSVPVLGDWVRDTSSQNGTEVPCQF